MQKIVPFLWFDNQAEEATGLYTSLFRDSRITDVSRYGENSPGEAGTVITVGFELAGQAFTALNGGPVFSFTPAISLFVSCESVGEIDRLWASLSQGGQVLMDLGSYPFSERFGWTNDRFGVSWQLNLAPRPQKIAPFLMFVGDRHGKAEEALHSYIERFPESEVVSLSRYGAGEPGAPGTVKHAVFTLAGQEFMAIDSDAAHAFDFTPALSFFVNCATQEEVDDLWSELSAGGEPGQCGWLADRFGVSWQIVPAVLIDMMSDEDAERAGRVTQAMLKMTKLDIGALERAYEGEG